MCGIVGKIYFNKNRQVDREILKKMTDALRHRGPDDEGQYLKGNVGLGFRRLSIIDLSPAGHQPMSNEDGSVWIIFNGEIYNYLALKPELQKRGHVFKSNTDTETVIHLYEEYGVECLKHLRGMFAFAIWDENKEQLFLARDRVGKKPLKYFVGKDFLVFGSELKSFFLDPEVPKEIDYEAIHHYLTFQYVPHPRTGFAGIQKLAPGSFLTLSVKKSPPELSQKKYWQLDFSKKLKLSDTEWQAEILKKLEESVKMRMLADVPLGAFLSGGVDSSAVVAMMARHSAKPVKTFSIGFEQETHNELPKARIISKMFNTEHTEFMVKPEAIELLPKLVYHFEEPYADSSAIPTYYVAQETRKYVKVALNGDGGDENFAGYPWYNYQKLAAWLDVQPLKFGIRTFASLLGFFGLKSNSTFVRRLYIFTKTHALPRAERYMHYFTSSYFTDWEKADLYNADFQENFRSKSSAKLFAAIYNQANTDDPLDSAFFSDLNSYLPDDLLVKVDIASMANSLEARSPFLDHEFLELVAQIPPELKLKGFKSKALLKAALKQVLPPEILNSPKHGFTVPLGEWFRRELHEFARQELLSSGTKIKKILNSAAIKKIITEHQNGKIDHGSRIWSLLTLEFWLRTFHNNF